MCYDRSREGMARGSLRAPVLHPGGRGAADDGSGAARELARKTAAFAGRGEPVSRGLAQRLLAGIAGTGAGARRLRSGASGGRRAGSQRIAPAAKRVSLSRKIARSTCWWKRSARATIGRSGSPAWKRAERAAATASGVALEKKLVWEQDEPMLDVAFPGAAPCWCSPRRR